MSFKNGKGPLSQSRQETHLFVALPPALFVSLPPALYPESRAKISP